VVEEEGILEAEAEAAVEGEAVEEIHSGVMVPEGILEIIKIIMVGEVGLLAVGGPIRTWVRPLSEVAGRATRPAVEEDTMDQDFIRETDRCRQASPHLGKRKKIGELSLTLKSLASKFATWIGPGVFCHHLGLLNPK
jgi:hypothetical protein